MKKLAVLIPVYNAGERLRRSVDSCAASGLSAKDYSLIVVDNCSTDGSIEALPCRDAQGVPIEVHHNESNLGRAANWNRALEIAERQGFRYVTFLFAGDTWTGSAAIAELLIIMDRTDAVLGMAPLRIVEEQARFVRDGARISIPGTSMSIASDRLLEQVVRIGRLPFAPIQANVYRLFSERPLRFSEESRRALNTDIEATVSWLQQHPGQIALISAPYLVWSRHPHRFLSQQDPWSVLLETRRSLERISAGIGVEVNWKSANAVSLLTSARELMPGAPLVQRFRFLWNVAKYLHSAPGGLDFREALRFTLNKLVRKQSYLSLDELPHTLTSNDALSRQGPATLFERCGL
jgi:glycosyltransferase involved in cell wall biosynthesis